MSMSRLLKYPMRVLQQPGSRRRATILVGVLLIVIAALKWGSAWVVNRYAASHFGPQAATFHVNPLVLSAWSNEGKAQAGDIAISWKGAIFHLLGGRLAIESVSLGEEGKPAAYLEGITVSKLLGVPVVRVRKVVVQPLDPLWTSLYKASTTQPRENKPLPLFAVWVEKIQAATPMGLVEGNFFLGDGATTAQRPFCSSFAIGQDGKGEVQGFIGEKCSASGKISLKGMDCTLEGRLEGTNWSLDGHASSFGCEWTVDGAGDHSGRHVILLQNSETPNGSGWLYGTIGSGQASRDRISTVELFSAPVTLPNMKLGANWSIQSLKLHAENVREDILNKENSNCLSLGGDGIIEDHQRRVVIPVDVNLNWRGGGTSDVLLVAALGGHEGVGLKNLVGDARLVAQAESVSAAENTFQGAFEGTGLRAWISGMGSFAEGSTKFGLQSRFMAGLGDLAWNKSGWSGQFNGTASPPADAKWPLPQGRWKFGGSASWVSGAAYPEVEFDGSESQGAALKAEFKGGLIKVNARRLDLDGVWGSFHGADFGAEGSLQGGALAGARINGTVAESKVGNGFILADVKYDAAYNGSSISGQVSATLPALDGYGKFPFAGSSTNLPALKISGAELNLLKGDVRLAGLVVENVLAWPKPLTLNAATAFLFGSPSGPLKGTAYPDKDGAIIVDGEGPLLGGSATFRVRAATGGAVEVAGTGFDAWQLAKFAARWAPLPFSAMKGKLDGSVTIPLEGVPTGINGLVDLQDVTLDLGDERHQLRNAAGQITFAVGSDGTRFGSDALTLESGRLPMQMKGKSLNDVVSVDVDIPDSDAAQVQNAFFDFLPEYIGFGTVTGKMGCAALLTSDARDKVLNLNLRFKGAQFSSEDKAMSLQGIDGVLPFSLSVGLGTIPARRGFKAPDEQSFSSAFEAFRAPLEKGVPLTIKRAAFSVYAAEDISLSSNLTEDGATDVRVNRGTLWDGEISGEMRVGISSSGLGYSGQLMMKNVSLRELCNQAGGLTGFIGGRMSGHVTFGADKFGLAALRLLAGFSVDPAGDEPMVIGRDFLVKIGGAQMKRLVPTRFLNYDKAAIGFGVSHGSLSVTNLVLQHEANPFKALIRKDISFEIRVPYNNSISIYQLLDSIKGLQERSATVQ